MIPKERCSQDLKDDEELTKKEGQEDVQMVELVRGQHEKPEPVVPMKSGWLQHGRHNGPGTGRQERSMFWMSASILKTVETPGGT